MQQKIGGVRPREPPRRRLTTIKLTNSLPLLNRLHSRLYLRAIAIINYLIFNNFFIRLTFILNTKLRQLAISIRSILKLPLYLAMIHYSDEVRVEKSFLFYRRWRWICFLYPLYLLSARESFHQLKTSLLTNGMRLKRK